MSETYNLIAVVKAKTKEAIRKFNDFTKGVKSAKKELTAFEEAGRYAAGFLVRDMVRGLTAAYSEALKFGSSIETLKNSFEALTQAQGVTDASLLELRRAVRGTVSDIDLLIAANTALSFKIPYEEFVRYAEAVTVVGRAVGIDATKAIQDFTVAMGRLSPRILDNLGIQLPLNEAYEIYAERLGKTVDSLSDAERAVGYQTIATERLIEKAEILADTTSEAQISMERYAASIKNLKTAIGELLTPFGAITPILEGAMPFFGTFAAVLIPTLIAKYGLLGAATYAWGGITATVSKLVTTSILGIPILGWITAAIVAVKGLSEAWEKNWFNIQQRTKAATDFILDYLEAIGEAYDSFVEDIRAVLAWVGNLWDNLTGRLDRIYDAQIVSIEESYEEQVRIIKDNLATAFEEVKSKYTDIRKTVEDSHGKEIEELIKFWRDKQDWVAKGLDKVVEEYEAHYDQLVGDTKSHHDDLISDLKDHVSETISNITQSHDEQLSKTTAFYDEMLAEASAFLVAIREGRSRDLDDLELNFLLQKQALKDALESQMLTSEEYEEALSSLEKAYRESRGDIRDDYRIQELQAEDEFRTDEERINAERTAALEKLEQEKADKITTIEEGLKVAVEGLEQAKADKIASINEERKTKIEEIRADEAALEKDHAYEMEQLERKKAAEIAGIQAQAELDLIKAQRQFHTDLEDADKEHKRKTIETWGDLWDSVKESARAIGLRFAEIVDSAKAAYDKVVDWWTKATGKKSAIDSVVTAAKNAYDKAVDWWNKATGKKKQAKEAEAEAEAAWDSAETAWDSADAAVTAAEDAIEDYIDAGRRREIAEEAAEPEPEPEVELPGPEEEAPPPQYGYGGRGITWRQRGFEGWVNKPTLFGAGEAGPEYVSITPRGKEGRSITINGPLVVIEGSADPKTAKMAADLVMQEIRKIA